MFVCLFGWLFLVVFVATRKHVDDVCVCVCVTHSPAESWLSWEADLRAVPCCAVHLAGWLAAVHLEVQRATSILTIIVLTLSQPTTLFLRVFRGETEREREKERDAEAARRGE